MYEFDENNKTFTVTVVSPSGAHFTRYTCVAISEYKDCEGDWMTVLHLKDGSTATYPSAEWIISYKR